MSNSMFPSSGAIFGHDSLQAHTAFRYEIEKHNNGTQSGFKLDKYEKIIDLSDGYALNKASKYITYLILHVRLMHKALRKGFIYTNSQFCFPMNPPLPSEYVQLDYPLWQLRCTNACGNLFETPSN